MTKKNIKFITVEKGDLEETFLNNYKRGQSLYVVAMSGRGKSRLKGKYE